MPLTVLVAHPSPDLYGSDLQLLESVRALRDVGHRVVVTLPADGPLTSRLAATGAEVRLTDVPVLRKALLSPGGLLRLAVDGLRGLLRAVRTVRAVRPDVVYVNTVTIPVWLVAAATTRTPSLAHVHEAEEDAGRAVRTALTTPLLLARAVVVNSEAALRVVAAGSARAARRASVVYNGVPGPPEDDHRGRPADDPHGDAPHGEDAGEHVVLVGRLSPRKGTDVALEAVARLRSDGRATTLELCGSTAPGYEWFERDLRERAGRDDLAGAVTFGGYTDPTWPALARARVVVVPSRTEPFGNTAVEAQLAGRAVVVSDVGGLSEIVTDGVDGLRVPPGSADALASALGRVLDDGSLRTTMAARGRSSATERFGTTRYAREIVAAVERVAVPGRRQGAPELDGDGLDRGPTDAP